METRFTPLTSTHAITILETLQAIDIGFGNSPRPVMVFILTSLQPFDFRFLYTNRAVTELTGFEREVLEHHSLSAIFPPQLNQLQFEKLAHAINSHFQDTIDLICRALDGTEHFVKATISPWRNTTELPWYFTVECQETTEYPEDFSYVPDRPVPAHRPTPTRSSKHSLTGKLSQFLDQQQQFWAKMSHEIRTPLQTIIGLSHVLQGAKHGPLTEPQRNSVKSIEESAQKLLSIVNSILDLSRIESGKLSVNIQPIRLQDLVDPCVRSIQPALQARRLHCEVVHEGTATTILGDLKLLRQSFLQLLDNAIKFSPPDGQLGITTRYHARKHSVHLTVWDHGPGISSSSFKFLFWPFTQIDGSLARQHEGAGLGLPVTVRLVQAQGGCTILETKPGQGSRFTIVLPATTANSFSRPDYHLALDALTQTLTGLGRPVLFQSSHQALVSPILQLAEGLESTAILTHTTEDSLHWLNHHQAAALVIEAPLVTREKLELISQFQRVPGLGRVPLVLVNSLDIPGDAELCEMAGVTHYICNPVTLPELADLLQTCLPKTNP